MTSAPGPGNKRQFQPLVNKVLLSATLLLFPAVVWLIVDARKTTGIANHHVIMLATVLVVLVLAVVGAEVRRKARPRAARRELQLRTRDGNGGGAARRRIVFKVCPTCAELVLLEASVCKYCRASLRADESTPPRSKG